MNARRAFLQKIIGGVALMGFSPVLAYRGNFKKTFSLGADPTQCNYAPDGEYIKDHSFVFHDGWYHLFGISGTEGYYHGNNGNEETFSWSISKDLVRWEMRGHVMHASLRKGHFDEHEVWAPYVLKTEQGFYMFYTGIIHPNRPLTYGKPTPDHKWIYEGHKETQGLAFSKDLSYWEKISDEKDGIGIPGRDSHVVWRDDEKQWLLYTTGPGNKDNLAQAFVSRSDDLVNWDFWGVCALFPGSSGNSESLTVMKHPLTGQWIMLANNHYATSSDPLTFLKSEVKEYNRSFNGMDVEIGIAGEMVQHNGKWYRSGFVGKRGCQRLIFTEIEWDEEGAFNIVKPSIINK